MLRADGKSKKHSEDLSILMVNVYRDSFKGPRYSTGDHMIAVRADKFAAARQKKSGPTTSLKVGFTTSLWWSQSSTEEVWLCEVSAFCPAN